MKSPSQRCIQLWASTKALRGAAAATPASIPRRLQAVGSELRPPSPESSQPVAVRLQYPRVYAAPGRFDEAHYRAQWALLLNNGGRRTLHKVAGYMKERRRMGEQWTGPLHRLELPLRVIWGRQDPIAVYEIARRLCANQTR